MTPIRLETERMILRTPLESDFAAVAAFAASPRTQYMGGVTTDEFQQWRGFLSVFGHWTLRGYGFFTLVEKGTGALLGRVGLVNHIMWPEPELGWHTFEAAEGKGYAFEAAMAVRDWAWRELGLGPLISQIHPDNTRSRALAERMGAVLEQETELLGSPCLVYRHPDPRGAA
ncbi:GNAT family N-acetyltransferase [Pseudoprimorskyibacter insulae]|uniref:N-acetyltransferase domain-containing protein n=1 Tax=Pseudoprimorskyibacter insulae TaxID=1695997 RepID=A0A2R8AN52_9RHOB|nr:GNAT family N-acetyltransferase [Pseudoprimorskyibacter insulae]SPF77465.1 hypothetical protein PRI8871_00047 [Pseudoprimorskyibacter insulae]